MTTTNTTTRPTATPGARELLLNLISGKLERIRATPEWEIDFFQEATDLLEKDIEAWTTGFHADGYLILRDPADEITIEDAK